LRVCFTVGDRGLSQAIATTGHEIEIAPIAKNLQLLPNFLSYMPIAGVDLAELLLEVIYVVQSKLSAAKLLDTTHDIYQPASCLQAFVAKKESFLPLCEHFFLRLNLPRTHEEYFACPGI
jgi:hypothetical protein